MTDDRLIKELRNPMNFDSAAAWPNDSALDVTLADHYYDEQRSEAADRIEELEAENARHQARIKELEDAIAKIRVWAAEIVEALTRKRR